MVRIVGLLTRMVRLKLGGVVVVMLVSPGVAMVASVLVLAPEVLLRRREEALVVAFIQVWVMGASGGEVSSDRLGQKRPDVHHTRWAMRVIGLVMPGVQDRREQRRPKPQKEGDSVPPFLLLSRGSGHRAFGFNPKRCTRSSVRPARRVAAQRQGVEGTAGTRPRFSREYLF